jgi:hypothetical protein
MLRLTSDVLLYPGRPSRRTFLRVGGTGAIGLGLSLPTLIGATVGRARAKSLILFALEGGPSHIDLWDMKPDAPENIRGEFRPIATTVPGLARTVGPPPYQRP